MTPMSDAALSPSMAEEKAVWYREVLELEPGSKVFLPFARLLTDLGRADEAETVLREGLARHPEFMEARLFLIDVLHKSGDAARCGAEVARLAGLFRAHPGFWDAWSRLSEDEGGTPDMAVSLGFLGALFRNGGLTLVDVLAAGLKALRAAPENGAELGSAYPFPAGPDVSAGPTTSNPTERGEERPEAGAPPAARADAPGADAVDAPPVVPEEPDSPEDSHGVPGVANDVFDADVFEADAPEAAAPVDLPFVFAGDALYAGDVMGEPPLGAAAFAPVPPLEEKCSLRTRSMAEVLAEQGDVRGAVDIYEELLATCRPEDRPAVLARLESLRAQLGAGVPVQHATASAPARNVPVNKSRNGMLDLLEKLAVRLETKARQ